MLHANGTLTFCLGYQIGWSWLDFEGSLRDYCFYSSIWPQHAVQQVQCSPFVRDLRSFITWLYSLAIQVVEISNGGINLKDLCLRISILKGNNWILRIGFLVRCQKVPKSDFQSQFFMSKIIRIFLNFFSLKNINFFCRHFLKTSISKAFCLLKSCLFFNRLI